MVAPLEAGTVLQDRFRIAETIGQGGFSIVYRVHDLLRNDDAVVKELVPPGSQRESHGHLNLGTNATAQRSTFLKEAQRLARLNLPGILTVRHSFVENGTAYVATDAADDGKTLAQIIKEQGPLDPTGAMDIAYQLIETLESIHQRELLHRDVKPSNVLIDAKGRTYLLDFGAARTWTADALDTHTVLFTPGYAPPEQLVAVAKRGPATDVYGLCATLFAVLAGRPPEDANARVSGHPLTSLAELRPDVDPSITAAIEAGLALRASDRPESMTELRRLFDGDAFEDTLDTLESLDALLARAQRFVFARRACPGCGGVLETVKPIGKDACPVCRAGKIVPHKLAPRACPHCKLGILQPEGQPTSLLQRISQRKEAVTATAFDCDACKARFEPIPDGRWRQTAPEGQTGRALYPDEWAKIAAGLPPDAGDAECDACGADYLITGTTLTLIEAVADPNGYAERYRGRPLPKDRVRWLAMGKQSPHSGLVCESCATEFDHAGNELTLIDSPNRRLDRVAGTTRSLESWHRLAEGLPEPGREAELEDRIALALATAYRKREVGFGAMAWKGAVEWNGQRSHLVAHDDELRIGRGLRVRKIRVGELHDLHAEGDWLIAEDTEGPFELKIEPVELVAHLRSGNRSVVLTAADLAARLV